MNPQDKNSQRFSFLTSRREFLKTSATAVAGAALARPGYTAEDNTLKIALVGCGGRGTGAAAQAMSTSGPTKLWAMADVFEHRLAASYKGLSGKHAKQMEVPADRQFIGFDGYKKAIDSIGKGGVVLLTTPPAFRPLHVEYAVSKGVHVFMEKSFGSDVPGALRIKKAGEEASKNNLKVAGGLMSRHYKPLAEAVENIHKGLIGDVVTAWAYREHGPVGYHPRKPGVTEMGHQVANYSAFTWLNGTFLLDWLIHNLDICCWVKDAWPVSCQGMGGRQVRTDADQLFDHYAAEYTFPDGTRLFAQGRHQAKCWGFFGDIIHGAKGSAVLGEGVSHPRIFKTFNQTAENQVWEYKGEPCNHYQVEHDLFFAAIRNDKPYNEADRCVKATLVGIMGRMACETGQLIKWDDMLACTTELAPGLENFTMDSKPPVVPDEKGNYPVAMPGRTAAA
ncbi:MAG: twin-arginine translocation signal domain-containing protein [Verrucomicrobiia bacterium]